MREQPEDVLDGEPRLSDDRLPDHDGRIHGEPLEELFIGHVGHSVPVRYRTIPETWHRNSSISTPVATIRFQTGRLPGGGPLSKGRAEAARGGRGPAASNKRILFLVGGGCRPLDPSGVLPEPVYRQNSRRVRSGSLTGGPPLEVVGMFGTMW